MTQKTSEKDMKQTRTI